MTRVGVTGHQSLTRPDAWGWVEAEVGRALDSAGLPLVGLTCLARGTDQLFARLVLERGGSLDVVSPFDDYVKVFTEEHDRRSYRALMARASRVRTVSPAPSPDEAYFAAGKLVVDDSERLLAVWERGRRARTGDTGSVVDYARAVGRQVIMIDPLARTVG